MILTGIEIKGLNELCEKRNNVFQLCTQLKAAIADLEKYLNYSEIKLVENFSGSEETDNNVEHDFRGSMFIK